ncbi:MAG: 50S ribosomal protein L22 [Candidatus Wildermuthbacteria bacterium]|nr:50S ribosomal protein L22 [Candidatus Wildermuthbacteria bacterium]
MKATAYLRNLRIAPRKVRLVADLVRGKSALEARDMLNVAVKKGAMPLLKLLNSAVASAKQKFSADESNLRISRLTVDEGPKLKRFRPRARGQAYPIQKKTSHITLELNEIAEGKRDTGKPESQPQPAVAQAIEGKDGKKFERPAGEVQKPRGIRAMQRIFRRKAI